MAKNRRGLRDNPAVVIVGLVLILIVLLAGASFVGQREEVGRAEANRQPAKKFRAKSGTERKNARALTSSQRSAPEEKGEGKQRVWGSLESMDKKKVLTRTEQSVKKELDSDTPEEGIRTLLKRLNDMDGNQQTSTVYSALASMYRELDPPMLDEAEKALALAWEHAQTIEEKTEAVYVRVVHDLSQGDFEGMLEAIGRLEGEELPVSGQSLELGVMMGVAYEQLGFTEDAKTSYRNIMEQAKGLGLNEHEDIADMYRRAGLNLSLILRGEGNEQEAQLLSRRVRSDLAP